MEPLKEARWPGVPIGKIQFGVAFGGIANVTDPPCWGVPPLADDPPSPEEQAAAIRATAAPNTASVRGLFIGAPWGDVHRFRRDAGRDDTGQDRTKPRPNRYK